MTLETIDPHLTVRYAGRETKLCLVAHDSEFQVVDTGKKYAAITSVTHFRDVPVGGRFKVGPAWFAREKKGLRLLDPNMPFGQPMDKPVSNFLEGRSVTYISVKELVPVDPTLKIAGRRFVRQGDQTVLVHMQDLRVLNEFSDDGHRYQLVKKPARFGTLPLKSRIFFKERWYIKTGDTAAKLLDPSAPLADPCPVVVIFKSNFKVDLLEVRYRGPDTRAAVKLQPPRT